MLTDYQDSPRSGGAGPPIWGRLLFFPDKNYHKPGVSALEGMPAKDRTTFMIRGQVIAPATGTRAQAVIDLGSYVNLGLKKSTALRVHSIQTQFCDNLGLVPTIDASAGAGGQTRGTYCCAVITTAEVPASFTGPQLPQLSDDYVMHSVSVSGVNPNDDNDQGILTHDTDIAPQGLTDGYLVAVDNLYMYATADDAWNESVYVNFLLECSLEAIDQNNAVSLSLSQQ